MEANGEGERGSMLLRCASQSSLDESSQRPPPQAPSPPHADELLECLQQLRRDHLLCDVILVAGEADVAGEPVPAEGREAVVAEGREAVIAAEVVVGDAGAAGDIVAGAAVVVKDPTSDSNKDPPLQVLAHRVVLAACSPYFRAMFTQFDERTQHSITIQNVEHHALEAIVEYIYNPESLVINEDNVQSLLSAASLLAVTGARTSCCNFLAGQLSAENALGIRAFAELHGCSDLANAALQFIERNFEEVSRSEEYLSLEPEAVCRVLSSDALAVPGEEAVLEAALRWVEGGTDREERNEYLPSVLENVRLPLVPRDELLARAKASPLVDGPLRVKDLVIEALTYHLLRPEERASAARFMSRARPRRPPIAPQVLFVAGGQAPKAIRDVEAYHLGEGRWYPAPELLSRRCRAGLGVVDGRVYAVGGFNGTLRVRSVDVFDPVAGTWTPGPSMCARRSTLGVAVIGTNIYAVGGFDGATGLSSVEVLDTRAGVWRELAPMSVRRSSVGVAVLDGLLYAVGGYDGGSRQCLCSVERYDPAADRWTSVPDMAARRSGAGVGVVDGILYAVGGHDGPAVRRSVEAFSPSLNAWRPAAAMCVARRNAGVASVGGRLYVVGGDDGASNLPAVEMYCPLSDTWTLLPSPMSVGRSYAGVAVLPPS